jgi:hypothetical protein
MGHGGNCAANPGSTDSIQTENGTEAFRPDPRGKGKDYEAILQVPRRNEGSGQKMVEICEGKITISTGPGRELVRLRKEAGNDKEWTANIRRTAGRNQQKSLLMDPRIDWMTKQEPKGLTQVWKLFQWFDE